MYGSCAGSAPHGGISENSRGLCSAIIGQALYAAQCGEAYPSVKALKGFAGASVLEIVAPFETDTYRTVFTVQFGSAIYVLHAFKKKAKKGRKTPGKDINLVKRRLEAARQDHNRRQN